jgi:hypothetical protein
VGLWDVWLLAAAGLHLGFQATVTLLVYPALVEQGRRGQDWAVVHAAHSRRITPLVVLVYGGLVPPVTAAVWQLSGGRAGWGAAIAAAGALLAFATTALVAAPAHGRLSRGWGPAMSLRLVRADVVRLVGAVICLAGAVAAV